MIRAVNQTGFIIQRFYHGAGMGWLQIGEVRQDRPDEVELNRLRNETPGAEYRAYPALK